jgi:diacylglycerol kinase (ATP)
VTIRLLLNPASGRRRGARHRDRLRALAVAAGVEFEESAGAADLAARARRARDEGIERLLVGGGDGTWHWAAQGLAGGDTALAPIPLGTGNDLARELGYPLSPERAFACALAGGVERIDLGRLDLAGGGERRFCGVAGVGFDAAVAEHARSRVRWLRGPAVYAWATLVTLARYRPPAIELVAGARRWAGEVYFVAFANTSHYGGGMRIAPGADPADGRLDLVIVHRTARRRLLAVFPKVYRGTHLGDPAVELWRSAAAELRCAGSQPINADGEGLGETGGRPLGVAVEPAALAVIRAGRLH